VAGCGGPNRYFAGLVVALTTFAFIPMAFAQGEQMGGEERMVEADDEDADSYQEMLRLSAEGNEHFNAGRFQEAAEVYAAAYDAYPQPILLKNQMITRYLIEECEKAIELGEAFLEAGDGGTDEDQEDVEAVFGECSLDLASEARDDDDWRQVRRWLEFGEPYFYDVGLRDESEELRAELEEQSRDDVAGVDDIDDVADAELDVTTIAGWSLVSTGVASLAGATIWYARSESQVRALDEMARDVENGEVPQSTFDDAQESANRNFARARWAVPTLYGVGAVATLAGVGLLVWPMIQGDEGGSASIQPIFDGDRAGALFTLTF
jgi:tetratricopeptide (TPR) repeat protein